MAVIVQTERDYLALMLGQAAMREAMHLQKIDELSARIEALERDKQEKGKD